MESIKFIKRIKKYSIISFLVPLIAINSCLLLYKFFGQTDLALYPNYNWNDNNQEYSWDEWRSVKQGDNLTLTNCPKNQYFHLWKSKDGVIISDDERGSISKDEYVSNINKIHQLQKNNESKLLQENLEVNWKRDV